MSLNSEKITALWPCTFCSDSNTQHHMTMLML